MQKLKIRGKNYPFKFGVRAVKSWAEEQGDVSNVDLNSLDELDIGYIGCKYGAEASGKKFMSRDEFIELIDTDFEAYHDLVNMITAIMPRSKNGVSPKAKIS